MNASSQKVLLVEQLELLDLQLGALARLELRLVLLVVAQFVVGGPPRLVGIPAVKVLLLRPPRFRS